MRHIAHGKHRNTQKSLHGFTRIYTEKRLTQRRKGTRSVMSFCSYVQKSLHTESTEHTEFCSACCSAKVCAVCVRPSHPAWFCGFRGLLSPHKFGQRLSVPCENYCTQTPQNNADALRNFAPLREKKDMSFCSYVQNFVSHRTHGIHRILLRMLLRMSAPSA